MKDNLRSLYEGTKPESIEVSHLLVLLLAYVDDLDVLADSAEDLQRSLAYVWSWACRLRMRLNLGHKNKRSPHPWT